jgi:chemotaxis protein MotB
MRRWRRWSEAGRVRVTQNARGVTVEINASVLFDAGEAEPRRQRARDPAVGGRPAKGRPTRSRSKATPTRLPIANAAFPSNWELSAVRASSVVRLFIDSGVAARRLAAIGRGANVPIASNDDPIGRARNRRVAVTILSGM